MFIDDRISWGGELRPTEVHPNHWHSSMQGVLPTGALFVDANVIEVKEPNQWKTTIRVEGPRPLTEDVILHRKELGIGVPGNADEYDDEQLLVPEYKLVLPKRDRMEGSELTGLIRIAGLQVCQWAGVDLRHL